MKFMFVICKDVDDAARWFESVVLSDFWGDERVTYAHAIGIAKEYSKRLSHNARLAIHKAVNSWNEKRDGRPFGAWPFDKNTEPKPKYRQRL